MNEFTEIMIGLLQERLGKEVTIKKTKVMKNNGIIEAGISISKEGSVLSPNIYIESLYRRYQGGEDAADIADQVVRFLKDGVPPFEFDIEEFSDFSRVKDQIIFKLINLEKNEKLLKTAPYERFMDLAMVFVYHCEVNKRENLDATFLLKKGHLKFWGVTKKEVYKAAMENTPRICPAAVIGMREILLSMRPDLSFLFEGIEEPHLYVMSNEKRINGASTMAYPNALRNFAKSCGKNLYVIPSSVHEVILVPEMDEMMDLNSMVSEVNRTTVDPKEVLSDHVYYYDLLEDKLVSGEAM